MPRRADQEIPWDVIAWAAFLLVLGNVFRQNCVNSWTATEVTLIYSRVWTPPPAFVLSRMLSVRVWHGALEGAGHRRLHRSIYHRCATLQLHRGGMQHPSTTHLEFLRGRGITWWAGVQTSTLRCSCLPTNQQPSVSPIYRPAAYIHTGLLVFIPGAYVLRHAYLIYTARGSWEDIPDFGRTSNF
jgi:hypothetical protein